jgi:hypothetical protein
MKKLILLFLAGLLLAPLEMYADKYNCKKVGVASRPGRNQSQYCIDFYLNENNPRYGISIGLSDAELQRASDTINIAINRHFSVNDKSIEETKRFIDICKEHFYG